MDHSPAQPASEAMPVAHAEFAFRSASKITNTLTAMLLLYIAINVASIGSNYAQVALLTAFENGTYQAEIIAMEDADANDERQLIIGFLRGGFYVLSALTFLLWQNRLLHNTKALGAPNMPSKWAWLWYAVPVMSLWKPYYVLKSISQASLSPSAWQWASVSRLFPVWWTLWIVSLALSGVESSYLSRAEEVNELIIATWMMLSVNVVEISLSIVFLLLIRTISLQQVAPSTEFSTVE